MSVKELNREQLDELKVRYATDLLDQHGEDISYGEIIEATSIPDEVIYNEFFGVCFTEDDFFCKN